MMIQKQNVNCIYIKIVLILILNILITSSLFAQNRQEIEIVIGDTPSEEKLIAFTNGEALRKEFKFREAITAYQQVISGGETSAKEAEAHYNIGLCYTWLGERDNAARVFNNVLSTHSNDAKAFTYASYGLAWLDVQNELYEQAIERLQKILDSGICRDKDDQAMVLFQIGRIYLIFLLDSDRASQVFRKVLLEYPDSKYVKHPFIANNIEKLMNK